MYGYSIPPLMIQEKQQLGAWTVCCAELSAKVLRWKSHHEKCPWQGRNSIFFIFSINRT